MEYIGLTREFACNIYSGVGVALLAFIIPFTTTILRPIKDRVVKQKEQLRSEMDVSTNYITPSELCILFDRLHAQEHKIEKIELNVNLAVWSCAITISLAVVKIFTSLLRWQIDLSVFILFALSTAVSVISIITSLVYYLNDDKK